MNISKHRIGIVGGSGYIGSALASYLSHTYAVKSIDRIPPRTNLGNNIEYQCCDILYEAEIESALEDVDLVIHTAIVQIPLINEEKKLGYETNVVGTQNVCKVVENTPSIKGMIVAGTWHVFGERELEGMLNEEFGFRPDKVEERARLYCLSKISQEVILRFYDEFTEKIYGIVRLGTVLGEGMPEKTAANIFISNGLQGKPITPYKHTMYRPMLYVDLEDVCRAFAKYAADVLNGEMHKGPNSLHHIINLCWPEPVTILELSTIVRDTIVKVSEGKIRPNIKIIDRGFPVIFTKESKEKIRVDISKAEKILDMKMTDPQQSIERIIKKRMPTARLPNR